MRIILSTAVTILLFSCHLLSQNAVIFGAITDIETEQPVDFATVYIDSLSIAAESDDLGKYRIETPIDKDIVIYVTRIGYQTVSKNIPAMKAGDKRYLNIRLAPKRSDIEVVVTASKIEDVGMVREEVHEMIVLPTVSGNLESALPSIALGTSSGTGGELTSQYSVRGGNYDENLIYVNGFEIFRPQLIRASQQEGLSFPNIDLVKSLSFSSGGFEAKYGDKLSSVLDIKYKRPKERKGSIGIGLLGASAHMEGSRRLGKNAYNKLRYLIGARYKTTKAVLSTLDTKGEYLPTFTDVQAYLTYDISRSWQIGILGNYNTSVFDFTPQTRATPIGSFLTGFLSFRSDYEGSERDVFLNSTMGISATYVPVRDSNPLFLKFSASNYIGDESESFDINGTYRLSEIDAGLGSDSFGEEVSILGTGSQHLYTRNELFNHIYNIAHNGGIEFSSDNGTDGFAAHFIEWGVKLQKEKFEDEINEWERLDSAGYTLPLNDEELTLTYYLQSTNKFDATKMSLFIQDSYTKRRDDLYEIKLVGGLRGSYRDVDKEFLLSPRLQLFYKPLSWNDDISFKISGGVYYQQAFYRELRRPDGSLNFDLKPQKSIHLVAGLSYDFKMESFSDKPFRLISEIYYKKLDRLVSYDVDNVRIRYSGENDASGYATGLDIRINGEFVPGAESWINLGFLRTRESINGVQHLRANQSDLDNPIEIDDVPRPTDQAMSLAMFFQDYLPSNENLKMNLNFSVGTGLPYGLKDNNVIYRNNIRYKLYHRVDIGFGYQLWDSKWRMKKPNHFMSWTDNAWISLEVFNLMKVSNRASVTWIKDITGRQYPIPNNLTSRRINLRLKVDF